MNIIKHLRHERYWGRWESLFDYKKSRAHCNLVRSLISKAKSSFSCNIESSANPRTLWKTLNTILHRDLSQKSSSSKISRCILPCQHIPWLFKHKIRCIRTKFSPSHSRDPFLFPLAPNPKPINFIPATLTEIYKLMSATENK